MLLPLLPKLLLLLRLVLLLLLLLPLVALGGGSGGSTTRTMAVSVARLTEACCTGGSLSNRSFTRLTHPAQRMPARQGKRTGRGSSVVRQAEATQCGSH